MRIKHLSIVFGERRTRAERAVGRVGQNGQGCDALQGRTPGIERIIEYNGVVMAKVNAVRQWWLRRKQSKPQSAMGTPKGVLTLRVRCREGVALGVSMQLA